VLFPSRRGVVFRDLLNQMREECVRRFASSFGRLLETFRHPIVNPRLQ
jgi:hypothetical protein